MRASRLPTPQADLEKMLANVKLPPGFKIERLGERRAAGAPDGAGRQGHDVRRHVRQGHRACRRRPGRQEGREALHHRPAHADGRRLPGQRALRRSTSTSSTSTTIPKPISTRRRQARSSTTTCRPTCRTAGSTWCPTARAGSTSPSARPATSACRRPALSQYRRVNPANGTAELVALGVRNSVGGAVDPRTGDLWFSENARDWLSDDMPSDKLNHVTRLGEHFGYPYCHQGDIAGSRSSARDTSAPSSRRLWSSSARTSRRSA